VAARQEVLAHRYRRGGPVVVAAEIPDQPAGTGPGAARRLHRDGSLVDDFYYERGIRQIHVLNAPSPAATAALEIGRRISDELEAGW
jgi:hypothetical protein